MTGDRAILDTNVAIALLNAEPGIEASLQSFVTLCLAATVVGELLFGALNSNRPTENVERVQKLVDRSETLDVTAATSRVYAELRIDLKKKGRPIPENDLWIAAAAVEHVLPLATRDVHFAQIGRLSLLP